ncbi:DNA polymerase III subunit delta [Virgibacillus sp. W0181]|uniref:DNA polymerase III subunit delta n=1 Tax=Virgibacillus sp. W0181 TaxID=3391581 RepID=UPI003F45630D
MLSFDEARQRIQKENFPSVVLLCGEEAYFITNIKQHIINSMSTENQIETSVYDLKETSIQEVIADAETYPFFSDKKIIIAENAVFLQAKQEKLLFDHDLTRLEQYLTNPVDYTILILVAPFEKMDERKRIVKSIKANAMAVACQHVKEQEVHQWINKMANQHKISIDKDATDVIAMNLSTDLYLIKNEITKLALYIGEGGTVTKDIVENLIGHTVNQSSLKLAEAVMDRNLQMAIHIYKDLEKMKEEPIAILALLAYQFRMILQVKVLKSKGYNQFRMQKQLKAHPYVIKIAYNRDQHFSSAMLKEIINKLTTADAAIKQGKMDKGIAFELLLYDLTQAAS